MPENIFEIETTALADVACLCESLVFLLTDFAAAYPSVNHSWIFHVLEKTALPEFIFRFRRRVYYDSTTHVEFAGMTRGQLLMARGVRQGCAASGFLFAMVFDRIFRFEVTCLQQCPFSFTFTSSSLVSHLLLLARCLSQKSLSKCSMRRISRSSGSPPSR